MRLPHDEPIAVPGFRFAGLHCGIKASGAPDLALVLSTLPATAAAVSTRNVVRAAPVLLLEERLRAGRHRLSAVLVNSGNANACTGAAGRKVAERTTAALAARLETPRTRVVPVSTGVIGEPLPPEPILDALERLIDAARPEGAMDFAEAIRTTDAGPKVAVASARLGPRRTARVMGIAKGAGMIHPRLATTLAFVLTDAPVRTAWWRAALRRAAASSFALATVDGDTSTNDVLLALASGAEGGTVVDERSPRAARALERSLAEVLERLARMVVADGEGAERLVRVEVRGLATERAARRVAERIATSLLVKTALHGCDPNWGRILAAAGAAGVPFDPERATLRIGDATVLRRGRPAGGQALEEAASAMRHTEYAIVLTLGRGPGRAHYWTCDLGPAYVRLNAEYHT